MTAQYARLAAKDIDGDQTELVRDWKAFLDEAEGTPGVPPQMIVRGLVWLSYTQGGNDNDASVAAQARAMALAPAAPDPDFDSVRLSNGSLLAAIFGKPEEAVRLLSAAEASRFGGRDDLSVQAYWSAMARNFIASQKGDGPGAIAASRRMAENARSCLAEGATGNLTALSNLGAALDAAGRLEESLAVQEKAVAWGVEHAPEASPAFLVALNNYGVDLRNSGRFAEAEVLLRKSVDLFARYQPGNLNQRATALSNLATTLDYMGRGLEAEALWMQALKWFEQAPEGSFTAPVDTLRFASESASNRGDGKLAVERAQAAVRYAEGHLKPDNQAIPQARLHLAAVMAANGRAEQALALSEAAVAAVRATLPEDSLRRMSLELAYSRVVGAAKGPVAGTAAARPVFERMAEKLVATDANARQRIRYRSLVLSSFLALARMAIDAGDTELAFRVMQLISISEITTAEAQSFARRATADPRVADRLFAYQQAATVRQSLDRRRNVAQAENPSELPAINASIAEADAALALRERELSAVLPDFARRTRPEVTDLASFRSSLRPDQVVIVPLMAQRGGMTMAITRDGMASAPAAPSAKVTALVHRIRGSIDDFRARGSAAHFDHAAARGLYDALFAPALRPILNSHRDLRYAPSGVLAELPLSLLEAPGGSPGRPGWLARTHAVTLLTGLAGGASRFAAASGAPKADLAFLGIGDPVTGPSLKLAPGKIAVRGGRVELGSAPAFAPLPGAAVELRQMGAAFGEERSVLLAGADATRAQIMAQPLDRFQIIAFATHGLAPSESGNAGEAALLLSPDGDTSVLLTASEIAQWKLNADWVVLSACNSAAGSEPGAPQLSGLASAFVRAGARNLLVSSWPLRDDAATRLTVATLRESAAGHARPEALRRAMMALADDPAIPDASHPAVWAAFSLVGAP
ncbi:Tetratricopeptide repeat-containing protein [Novosphingobium sp. CF614]|uniref:CHAT domain-containing protein n=1 Tax=Novosphingobium sp. CF614 TaxID=1884364 RepID=UPI0008EC77DF|nr:CHAT domain-containing tetratricopeptide repeat protein [Novosphingobium sp. CF614]SFG24498.1 Tetratricopeptide repeat-containing protein [Novosphingobium sp. CF614]